MANIIRMASESTRRIDGGVFEARAQAEQILAEARAAARRIEQAAAESAEGIREGAREAARSEAVSASAEMLVWAAAERNRLLASVEAEVVRLALAVASRVLCREAEHGDVAHDMARRALAEARERTVVALRIHPADLERVREDEAALSALVPRSSGIAWVADPAVGRGGAVVETETGSIDARLDAQLAVVRRIFSDVRP